jgi:hypothetical protein
VAQLIGSAPLAPTQEVIIPVVACFGRPNHRLQATNPRPCFQQSESFARAGSRLKLKR